MVDDLQLDFKVRVAELVFEPEQKKEKYNRARVKRETEKLVEEDLER